MTAIDPGTQSHPHRASAGPFCCFAGVSGPAMQRGGGSKLKGLTGDTPVPHADAANVHVILHDLSDTLRPLGASLCGESACHPTYAAGSCVLLCGRRPASPDGQPQQPQVGAIDESSHV